MSRSRKLGVAAAAALVLLGGGVVAARRGGTVALHAPALAVDLARPDALIETASVADLPRDLLAVPMFRDLLTEDFVTYYEQTEGRLSLMGTLRRLAYEHQLDLGDWVIRAVIDQPADIALWKRRDGRLGHALVVVQRAGLTRVLEMAARIALKDTQLRRVEGDLEVDAVRVPVYALAYARGRVLLFSGHGDRLVILSDAAMLTDGSGRLGGAGRAVVAGLLSVRPEARRVHRDHFALEPGERRHTVAVSAGYLSFGYHRLFPGVRALRFDFARDGWATRALFDPRVLAEHALRTRPLWSLVPAGPSACLALPVRWPEAAVLAEAVGIEPVEARRIVEVLDGPAAVCWYAKSRLYTPLFVVWARRPLEPPEAEVLERMFTAAIGAPEPPSDLGGDPRGAAPDAVPSGARVWQRAVTSPDGLPRAATPPAKRFFLATLARHRLAVAFSPDHRLVEDALAVASRTYPSLADVLPDEPTVLAVLVPASLGALAESEVFASLPAGQEPVFRNAASTHLVPRLAALKRYPAYALVLPGDAVPGVDRWLVVEWRPIGRP